VLIFRGSLACQFQNDCNLSVQVQNLDSHGGGRQARDFVSATRTPSCKDLRRNAMLRHDQALKEGLDEVAKAGLRAGT
jgi:hypothetical protein